MTADINVILQLLQRQMAPVPPAYSSLSPSTHLPHPASLYSTGAPTIHTGQTGGSASPLQVPGLDWTRVSEVGSAGSDSSSLHFQSPDSDFELRSKDSLSGGIQLTVAFDDAVSPEVEPPSPQLLHPNAEQPPGLLSGSQRFPSLPEHLETSTETQEIQRPVSDPVLPNS